MAQAWSVAEVLRAYVEDIKGIRPEARPEAQDGQTQEAAPLGHSG
jgi:glycogen debranching enzyme